MTHHVVLQKSCENLISCLIVLPCCADLPIPWRVTRQDLQ